MLFISSMCEKLCLTEALDLKIIEVNLLRIESKTLQVNICLMTSLQQLL